MKQQLYLEFKLPSLNEYINKCRHNKYVANNFKSGIESQIYYDIKQQRLKPVQSPVRLKFTWYESSRRRDKDNVASAKKFILDALQAAKILRNDNNKWVIGFSDEFVYEGKQGILIEIEEMEKT